MEILTVPIEISEEEYLLVFMLALTEKTHEYNSANLDKPLNEVLEILYGENSTLNAAAVEETHRNLNSKYPQGWELET